MASKFGLLSESAVVALHCFSWMVVLNSPRIHCSSSRSTPTALWFLGGYSTDVGTNNWLNTTAKANQPWYGIDYPDSVATGRFSNGLNLADYIARSYGFPKSPLSYFTIVNSDRDFIVENGSNMASGFSGVFRAIFSTNELVLLGEQTDQLLTIRRNLTRRLGRQAAARYFRRSICVIVSAVADIVTQSTNATATASDDRIFLNRLTVQIVRYIQKLYANGITKFAWVTPPSLGCTPFGRSFTPTGDCFARADSLVKDFNNRMSLAFALLSISSPRLRYAIGDLYEVNKLILSSPQTFGFVNVTGACCGTGRAPCTPTTRICGNRTVRDQYLFWDRFQVTQKTASVSAAFFFGAYGYDYVYPITFGQLAEY